MAWKSMAGRSNACLVRPPRGSAGKSEAMLGRTMPGTAWRFNAGFGQGIHGEEFSGLSPLAWSGQGFARRIRAWLVSFVSGRVGARRGKPRHVVARRGFAGKTLA